MTTDVDEQLRTLAIEAQGDVKADRCSIFELDREKGEVYSRVALGMREQSIRLSTSRGLVGAVARSGQVLNLRDAYNDPRFDRSTDQRTGYRTKSLLTMPIRGKDRHVIGVFQALNKVSGTFTEEDEAKLQRYCEQASQILTASS